MMTNSDKIIKVCFWPEDSGPEWAQDPVFMQDLDRLASEAKARHRVFLGYCSGARATANAIQLFIEKKLGVGVLNYALDFRAGPTILEQVSGAAETCSCTLLLFTKDDELGADGDSMAPRDNVVFEAGHFLRAKGKNRVAIIREDGAKMPADLGGCVYIPLKDRTDTSTIETGVSDFLSAAL